MARLPDGFAQATDGETFTCGYSADRAPRTAARASSKRACACLSVWLETTICDSSWFSCSSPKTSHHVPRSSASAGSPGFQSLLSLNAGGVCVSGGTYAFVAQAESSASATTGQVRLIVLDRRRRPAAERRERQRRPRANPAG